MDERPRPIRTTASAASVAQAFLHKEILSALSRHRLAAATVLLAGMGITTAYTASRPVMYKATASVLIEEYTRNIISLERQVIRLSPEVTKAQKILAESRPVIARAFEISGVHIPDASEGYISRSFSSFVDGQLLYMDVLDKNADRAAKLANAWAQAFVEEMGRRSKLTSIQARTFLEKSLPEMRNDWIAKQEALIRFEKESNFDMRSFEQHPIRTRYEELAKKLYDINARLAALEAELSILEDESIPVETRLQMPRSRGDQATQMLLRQLEERKARVVDLKISYKPDSHEVRSAEEMLREFGERLRAAAERILAQVKIEVREALETRDRLEAMYADAEKAFDAMKAKAYQHRLLSSEVAMAERLYSEMAQKKGESDISGRFDFSYARQWQQAETPSMPSFPNWRNNLLLGLLASSILAIFVVFALERMDDTIRTGKEVERTIGVEVAGVLLAGEPELSEEEGLSFIIRQPRSSLADGLRNIHIALEVKYGLRKEGGALVVTVTSATPKAGKSFVAANLSILFAQLGRRTLLVDGDIRKRSATKAFGFDSEPGFLDLLRGGEWDPSIARNIPGGCAFLPAGSEPSALSGSIRPEDLDATLARIRPEFDAIILDSPPVLAIADACIMSRFSDLTLVIARSRKTRMAELRRAVGALFAAGPGDMMIVVNGVDHADASSEVYYGYYGQGYKYGYGYGDGEKPFESYPKRKSIRLDVGAIGRDGKGSDDGGGGGGIARL